MRLPGVKPRVTSFVMKYEVTNEGHPPLRRERRPSKSSVPVKEVPVCGRAKRRAANNSQSVGYNVRGGRIPMIVSGD